MRELVNGVTEPVSVDSEGILAGGGLRSGSLSRDGRYVAFVRDGRTLRTGIDVALTRSVLAYSGARELIANGLLIDARLTDEGEASGAFLEHHRVTPFTYPGEWSFSMLRDAALTTLQVCETLARGGFELKNAHSYNVTFDGCRPVFIDFASIDRLNPRYVAWRAGAEYLDAFVRILRIWSRH